jgi:hypothetical protein
MAFATAVPAIDRTGSYGLARPDLAEARESLRQVHGAAADDHWAALTTSAGLTGTETDSASFGRLIEAMLAADPVTALCGRALIIRGSAYVYLADAPPSDTPVAIR